MRLFVLLAVTSVASVAFGQVGPSLRLGGQERVQTFQVPLSLRLAVPEFAPTAAADPCAAYSAPMAYSAPTAPMADRNFALLLEILADRLARERQFVAPAPIIDRFRIDRPYLFPARRSLIEWREDRRAVVSIVKSAAPAIVSLAIGALIVTAINMPAQNTNRTDKSFNLKMVDGGFATIERSDGIEIYFKPAAISSMAVFPEGMSVETNYTSVSVNVGPKPFRVDCNDMAAARALVDFVQKHQSQ